MGLTDRLLRAATRRPHVLLAPVPGFTPLRWAAEAARDDLGWTAAASPAEADVLLVCGPAGPELRPHLDVAWHAMPGPRVRTVLEAPRDAPTVLEAARSALGDLPAHRDDAASRPAPDLSPAHAAGDGQDAGDDMGDDMGHDMGHDMGGGMGLPGGLMMADRVEDRDGLRLEGLHLSLGPLLPAWPAGLRLDVVLSGDVVVEAAVTRLDRRDEPSVGRERRALDALAVLLEAAGWDDGARRARRARQDGADSEACADLLRRLERARLLRWSLRGLPGPSGTDLAEHLDRLIAVVRGQQEPPVTAERDLAPAVEGLEVGTAHLVVAAHGAWLAVPTRA